MTRIPLPTEAFPPPVQHLITKDDFLRLVSINSAAGVRWVIDALILREDGELVPMQLFFTPAATRSEQFADFRLTEGYLLSVVVRKTGDAKRGQLWCELKIVRGRFESSAALEVTERWQIITGYVYDGRPLSWPPGTHENLRDGPGFIRAIAGTNPAAGVEISESVPVGAMWRLLGWRAQLVAAAGGGTRVPILVIDDGVTTLVESVAPTGQAGGTTVDYLASPGLARLDEGQSRQRLGFPVGLILDQNYRIRTSTVALAAGDDWGTPILWVEEWLTS